MDRQSDRAGDKQMKITAYEILKAESAADLVVMVNDKIKAGWQPLGGVAGGEDTYTWMNERKGYEENSTTEVLYQAIGKVEA